MQPLNTVHVCGRERPGIDRTVFTALSDPVRRSVLAAMLEADRPRSLDEIERVVRRHGAAPVRYGLIVMRSDGLVTTDADTTRDDLTFRIAPDVAVIVRPLLALGPDALAVLGTDDAVRIAWILKEHRCATFDQLVTDVGKTPELVDRRLSRLIETKLVKDSGHTRLSLMWPRTHRTFSPRRRLVDVLDALDPKGGES